MVWTSFFSFFSIHPITFISVLQTVINVTTNQNTLKDLHFCLLFFSFLFIFVLQKKTDSNFSFNDILFSFGGAQECYKCKSARWAIKSRSGNLHELINSRREVESFFFFLVLFVAQKMVQPLFFHEYFNSFSILHPTTTSSFPIKQLKISTISHE